MPDDFGAVGHWSRPDPERALIDEILAGLLAKQKTLPAKLFYDEEGCRLFGLITTLPEYYPTRTELRLLERHAAAIGATAAAGSALVEYGASDETKASFLLGTGRFRTYVPIDIAPEALAAIALRLSSSDPDLAVRPVCADFNRPITLPDLASATRFGFFPGSTIGNMDPREAVDFLRTVRETLGPDASFLVGTDLRKDEGTLVAAYDDAAGITAAFNRNVLAHVNRIANGTFDPARFVHRARWNATEGRIEMHLESRIAQTVVVASRLVRFAAGETIHTENSYKYTETGFQHLAEVAGWAAAGYWTDDCRLFGIHLLEAPG